MQNVISVRESGVETVPEITASNCYISVQTETVMKNRYSE